MMFVILHGDRRFVCSSNVSRRGSALILVAMLVPVMLAVAAYCINVVYMELVRTELQIATDISTRAAGRTLTMTEDPTAAIEAAQQLAASNEVANRSFSLSSSDFEFGVSERFDQDERYGFEPGDAPNSVRLRTETFAASAMQGLPSIFPTMGVPVVFRPLKSAMSTQAEIDIVIVLDRSSSMAFAADAKSTHYLPGMYPPGWAPPWPVPSNSRWADTVSSVHTFLATLNSTVRRERVSLVSFSTLSTADSPLSEDYSGIKNAMALHSAVFLGGLSNLSAGMMEGIEMLSDSSHARPWASRVMLLMSDGVQNFGASPLDAAQAAAAEHVTIFTVSFSDEANQSLLASIAQMTTGRHYHASTGTELAVAFEEIAKALPNLLTD